MEKLYLFIAGELLICFGRQIHLTHPVVSCTKHIWKMEFHMSNTKKTFRMSVAVITMGLTTLYGSTALAQSGSNPQSREDIAIITNDARDGYAVKQDIISVLNRAAPMASLKDLEQIEYLINQVQQMSDLEVLGTFSNDFMQSFLQFINVLDSMETTKLNNPVDISKFAGASAKVNANMNLSNAAYNNICGDTRADTTATIIALGVFLVAEAVKEAAISGCGTVVVVAGVGGSPQSAVCSGVVAGVFQIARGVWEEFLLCQASIDSAEILGTYQRAEDIFNLVHEHDTEVKASIDAHDNNIVSNIGAIGDGIAQHDMDIKIALADHDMSIDAKIGQHDTDIKERLNEVGLKLDLIVDLLLTPHGQRPGWNSKP